MDSRICAVFLLVAVSSCYGQFSLSSTGALQATSQCSSSGSGSAKEQCLLNLCRTENPGKFECQALSCKVNSPGSGIQKKKATLRCVRGLCGSNSHPVCTGIKNCDALKSGSTGEAKYIICIAKLFPRNWIQQTDILHDWILFQGKDKWVIKILYINDFNLIES